MTNDEMNVLRDFRAEISPPSEETRDRIYAYATAGAQRSSSRRLSAWRNRRLPRTPKRMVAILGSAAICAAGAAVVVVGMVGGGGSRAVTQALRPTGGGLVSPSISTSVNYNRSGGALSSIAVTLTPDVADASIQLQVIHSDASTYAEAYSQEYAGNAAVVFEEQVPATPTPSTTSSRHLSTWSGTLSPSQWSGGCQSGLYRITWVAVGPGSSFASPGADSEADSTEWFSCSGS